MSAFCFNNPTDNTHESNKVDLFLKNRIEQKEKPEKRLFAKMNLFKQRVDRIKINVAELAIRQD